MTPTIKRDLEEVDASEVQISPVSSDKVTFSASEIALYDVLDQIDEDLIREYLGE